MASQRIPTGRVDRAGGAAVALLAAAFALFFILPFAGLVVRAAADGEVWSLVASARARDALQLSLITSTATLALTVVFGTPVAYLMARRRFRGHSVVDALIDLPIVLPPTVAGVALLTAFGRRGLVGEPLEAAFGLTLTFTTVAVVMAQTVVSAPFYVRAAKSGFDAVDPQFERVAYTLGASRVRTFVEVVLPQARPAMLAGVVLCWARALGELGATLIFAGSLRGRTQTMPLAILDAFERVDLGLPGAVAMSLVLLLAAVVVLVLFRRVARTPGYDR
ncbi:MAG: ABC transporter permease [Dehalococcoidia bacterium]